jgi:hypothetical protein
MRKWSEKLGLRSFVKNVLSGNFRSFSLGLESSAVATAFAALRDAASAEMEFVNIADDGLRHFNLL